MVLLTGCLASRNAEANFIDFEELPLNHKYYETDTFEASGIQVVVEKFYPVIGSPISGFAQVDSIGLAGGMGKEIGTHNADIKFVFTDSGFCALNLTLLYGDFGGDINLGINGDLRKAAVFTALPSEIGGTHITIYGAPSAPLLYIEGYIASLTIGGQNVYIDRVSFLEYQGIPEPSMVCLLGLGSLSLVLKRDRKKTAKGYFNKRT